MGKSKSLGNWMDAAHTQSRHTVLPIVLTFTSEPSVLCGRTNEDPEKEEGAPQNAG